MAHWNSAVGAAQLARLLGSQHSVRREGPGAARPTAAAADPAATVETPGTGLGTHPAQAVRKLPAYRSLAEGLRMLVLEGRIPVATRLPAERELAAALSVSRTTVAAAFEALRSDGFLESRRGSGSWTTVPAGNPLPTRGLHPLPPENEGTVIDLGCAALPAQPVMNEAFGSALEALPPYAHTHGDYPAGLPVLREALAERYTALGVPTMPQQIMVTTGALGGVGALTRMLVPRGERIAVEHPSYANVLQLLRETGGRLVPVPMADDLAGWDLPTWHRTLRESAPRLAYVVADFHNPTGALAGTEQRRELVAAARASGTVLIADETMADLPLGPPGATGTPSTGSPGLEMPRPMAAFDPGGSAVITVGSVSKSIWAGMRIGWIRAAPEVIRGLTAARAYVDLGSPVLEQLAVAELLNGTGWEQAVTERRARARENRESLTAALRDHLPDWEFTVPHGGLTLWVRTGGLSGSRIAEAGERLGVRVPSGPRFGVDGAFEGFVRLPFTIAEPLAREAASRLAAAAELVRSGAPTPSDVPRSYVA
ncbi:PLP-dependent aminotransferase family protein [Streptomyces qinglanensis]|uniref:DNA-binding transcriptional regulator, MocR family, contains an aminotransferase domain n=1 Tax=Streptomyces qinglanensis TaxID=943816 RepID=A0A1H9WBN8_9ACTN|nr:PLP-dependent aminotransferase family protein [Streptomyces qinglanensis]SES31077.1 DNA-binding transcriptional regulator, MocR family, contains an aminotransferase domain [Streptomyces qinglanensis]